MKRRLAAFTDGGNWAGTCHFTSRRMMPWRRSLIRNRVAHNESLSQVTVLIETADIYGEAVRRSRHNSRVIASFSYTRRPGMIMDGASGVS